MDPIFEILEKIVMYAFILGIFYIFYEYLIDNEDTSPWDNAYKILPVIIIVAIISLLFDFLKPTIVSNKRRLRR